MAGLSQVGPISATRPDCFYRACGWLNDCHPSSNQAFGDGVSLLAANMGEDDLAMVDFPSFRAKFLELVVQIPELQAADVLMCGPHSFLPADAVSVQNTCTNSTNSGCAGVVHEN